MLRLSRSTGRSSENDSIRSTSLTMRSVSSQISRVSARSSSPTELSSNCAAPRMPESGFLISWASIAPSAVTDRAALRWVSCLSIFSAIDRSCSMKHHAAAFRGRGETKGVDHSPEAGARRGDVELVAVDRRLAGDRLLDEAEHRRAERQDVGEPGAQQRRAAHVEEMFGRVVDLADASRSVERQHRLRQGVEQSQRVGEGVADRAGGTSGRQFMRPPRARDASKAAASSRRASPASSQVTSASRSAAVAPAFSA